MANFLFIIPPQPGHINPTIGIGTALIERGHKVTWMGLSPLPSSIILPAGGSYELPPEFRAAEKSITEIWSRQIEALDYPANRMIKWAFETVWLPYFYIMQPHMNAILTRLEPDFIFYDEGLVAVAMAAHQLDIPYATSISSAPGLYYPSAQALTPEDADWLKEIMNGIKKNNNIQTGCEILNSPYVNIVYTAKDFVNGSLFSEQYYFIGPALSGRPAQHDVDWSLLKSWRKSIYVSTGTLLDGVKQKFYQKIIDAFAGEDICVLIAADPELFSQWPDNFLVKSYWPQLEVLQHVDAVISHGGFNTINEALYFGVPLLVIPMAVDQFGNAHLVEQSGCGLRLRFKRLQVSQLRESIDVLLSNDSYRIAGQHMMQKIREGGGGARAADLLLAQLESYRTIYLASA